LRIEWSHLLRGRYLTLRHGDKLPAAGCIYWKYNMPLPGAGGRTFADSIWGKNMKSGKRKREIVNEKTTRKRKLKRKWSFRLELMHNGQISRQIGGAWGVNICHRMGNNVVFRRGKGGEGIMVLGPMYKPLHSSAGHNVPAGLGLHL
jgi:hypothetical protein